MTNGHYEVQTYYKGWFQIGTWECEPRHFSRFLDYLYELYRFEGEEDRAAIRVRRIPYAYGQTEWEFDGECRCHYKAIH